MKYLYYQDYEKMYKKYINKDNLINMMDLAGKDYSGKRFLDICCGNGHATIEALKRGASFCGLIDQEKDMVPPDLQDTTTWHCYLPHSVSSGLVVIADNFFLSKDDKIFDIVFCRQGINYWLNFKMLVILQTL